MNMIKEKKTKEDFIKKSDGDNARTPPKTGAQGVGSPGSILPYEEGG